MKRILTMMAACLAMAAGAAAQNPIFLNKAYNSDPQARVWTIDGKPALFVYGSKDENPSYYCSGKYDAFSTEDMIHWKGGESFSSRDIPYNDEVLYAPDCIEKDGKYYLFYSQPGPNPEGTAVADSPYGPFKDGIKPIRMCFHGDADKNLFTINSFRFE